MIEADGDLKRGPNRPVGSAGISGPQLNEGQPHKANSLWILGVQRQMLIPAGYVIGFDGAAKIVAGSGQITPPEGAHAKEILPLCSSDRIMTSMLLEGPGKFIAIVEAAALQAGEAETAKDRRIYGPMKLAAK
jgi:hypothetical protein